MSNLEWRSRKHDFFGKCIEVLEYIANDGDTSDCLCTLTCVDGFVDKAELYEPLLDKNNELVIGWRFSFPIDETKATVERILRETADDFDMSILARRIRLHQKTMGTANAVAPFREPEEREI